MYQENMNMKEEEEEEGSRGTFTRIRDIGFLALP